MPACAALLLLVASALALRTAKLLRGFDLAIAQSM
jgi:hypothetical protein